MTAITISRQLGSLGEEVAHAAANRLGYRVVCRDLINEAAIRCGSPEMALSLIDDLKLLGIRSSVDARRRFLESMSKVMVQIANEGNVIIVGRAGQIILKEHKDVLHVRIIAPVSLRIQRIACQLQISVDAAQAQIEASDRSRRNFLQRSYHVRWDDPELYDLIINTSRFDPVDSAWLICQALAHRNLIQS